MLVIFIVILFLEYFSDVHGYTIKRNTRIQLELLQSSSDTWIIIVIIAVAIMIAIVVILIIIYCCFQKGPYERIGEGDDVGPSGLVNQNESCYLNSMIQAVASSNKLIGDLNNLIKNRDKKNCGKLIFFRDLIKNINNPRYRKTCVKDNTKNLRKLMIKVGWQVNAQEDAFQLLSKIINSIEKEINDKILMPPKLELLHSFSENSNWNKVQEHLALALPLCGDFRNKPGVELEALMDAFFQPSKIEDSLNEMQLSFFQKAPNVMILHIQANEWNDVRGEYIKPKYYIIYKDNMKYTFNIQMKKDESEIKEIEVEYELRAVVHHMGSVTGGHYVTYRVHNGRWYLTNDEQVEEVSFNCDIIPYIMVYEKINEKENTI